ncbi:hypothetical protein [Streptacidiphilus anmyonensis]|uniref:hypothetical protein n=1 Tax=Streptacidiphilus anmyonensis TaxID=405782 RepID=UPI0005AB0FDF|nr:hypothetical protein [Streptacidiphilus anmyonensis]
MPAADSALRAPKSPGTPPAETLLIVCVSVAAFAAAHAVEGVVGIARDILRGTPSGDGTASADGPSAGPRLTATAAPAPRKAGHQAAGLVLIIGVAFMAGLVRRLLADLSEVVRDIGGARPAQGVRRAAKAAGAGGASVGAPPVRRSSADGHRHARTRARLARPDRAAVSGPGGR